MIALAAVLAGAPLRLTDRAEVTLSRPVITLADIADNKAAPRLGRLATVAVARLPIGRDRLTLSRRALSVLAHRVAPTLATGPGDARLITFRLRHDDRREVGCLVTRTAIPAGTAITRDRVEKSGACSPAVPGLRYDGARRVLVARHALPAGVSLGHLAGGAPAAVAVAAGDRLTLVSRSGPVRVERPVTALQPGRYGRRVFVRDGAGHVFAAPIEGSAP